MNTERQRGYYYVRFHLAYQIAFWDETVWHFTGTTLTYLDADILEINENRILMPDEIKPSTIDWTKPNAAELLAKIDERILTLLNRVMTDADKMRQALAPPTGLDFADLHGTVKTCTKALQVTSIAGGDIQEGEWTEPGHEYKLVPMNGCAMAGRSRFVCENKVLFYNPRSEDFLKDYFTEKPAIV